MSRSSTSFSLFQLIRLSGLFFKALIGKASDVQDAMAKLDRLSNLEDKVVQAIGFAILNQMKRRSYVDAISTNITHSLFLQLINFVQKLRNGLAPQIHLPIMLLLWKNGAARPADGLWKENNSCNGREVSGHIFGYMEFVCL